LGWLSKLRDIYDFVPPFETPYPVSDRPLLPWDICVETIEPGLKAFVAGLRKLNECGFNRVYVQAVVPPTLNDEDWHRRRGYLCPSPIRTKAVYAYNRTLTELCKSANVSVIDLWPNLTEKGFLKPEFELDGVHLHPKTARMHLDRLLDEAI